MALGRHRGGRGVQEFAQHHLGLDAAVLDVLVGALLGAADVAGPCPLASPLDLGASRMSADIVLSCKGLVKRFGGITATDKVNLQLLRGARHALIGPNGAGKTTLINLFTGVLPPTSGRIRLLGEDISHLAPHQRVQRGLVRTFQINQLFDGLTPLQTLAMTVSQHLGMGATALRPLGHDPRVAKRCENLLSQFHLLEVMDQPTQQLAYGKRRLLEMATAMACGPSVLLLDEPVAGVPAGEREELLRTVAALPADVSVLLIEHDMDLVFSFARSMTVMVNGAVLTEGTPAEMAADARVREVYLGHGGNHG